MTMLFSFILAILTLICLVPVAASVFYLILGVKSWITGEKEGNLQKTRGGIYSVVFSFLGIIASYLFWRFLVRIFFSWE